MYAHAKKQLGDLSETYLTQLEETLYSGAYDADWKQDNHPKLYKLITALRDEWEQKNSIRLIHGDFYEEVKKVGDGSVDLIVTDPPYNIARDNEFELEGRSNISQDFGEWDKFTDEQFIAFFSTWAREWARVLRDQGSGYVFTSDSYISHLRSALTAAGLHVKATIIWHKKNPGTQVVKTNFKSSVEYILFFTKGEGGHTFNWQGENEMHNFIETAICAGKERLVDGKGNTLHPTQKPESLLKHFMEISSNRGDMVFDGFMGVASSGAVAKSLGRKFIGIEQDKTYFDAAQRRLAE
jgi:site-specific DNA-methyltransferase (adenine-specific)/modification methylase